MRRAVEAAGVDYLQWRALVGTFLKIDFGAVRGLQLDPGVLRAALALLLTALIYFVSGLNAAAVIWMSPDPMLGAVALTTIVGFMVGSSLLLGEGLAIISPDDHAILGFRPVSSRTYLAVRLTTLLVRTVAISTFVGFAPAVVFLIKDSVHPGRAIGALVATYATGGAITLAIVAMYGWVLRVVGPTRVLRLSSYVQFAANTLVWIGFVAIMQGVERRLFDDLRLGDSVWVLLYPGVWFASYVELARGHASSLNLTAAALSAALLVVLVRSLGGKLSLDYADRLGRLTATAAPGRRTRRPVGWAGLLGHETRAVAILVRSQFRHDIKFRLGILSLIPITLIYFYIGMDDGPPGDPFVPDAEMGNQIGLVQVALLFLPMTLRRSLISTDAYRAAWIFHVTPADRTKLVLSARDLITLFFLVPYLGILAAVFAYFFGSLTHALLHSLFLGWLSYLVLQFSVMIDPKLPFSRPLAKDTGAGLTFGLMFVVTMVGFIAYMFITQVVYESASRMAITLAVFAAASWWMRRITARRVERSPSTI